MALAQLGAAREIVEQLARVLDVKPFCGVCTASTWRANGRKCVHSPTLAPPEEIRGQRALWSD